MNNKNRNLTPKMHKECTIIYVTFICRHHPLFGTCTCLQDAITKISMIGFGQFMKSFKCLEQSLINQNKCPNIHKHTALFCLLNVCVYRALA